MGIPESKSVYPLLLFALSVIIIWSIFTVEEESNIAVRARLRFLE